jgi:hypothetical protein
VTGEQLLLTPLYPSSIRPIQTIDISRNSPVLSLSVGGSTSCCLSMGAMLTRFGVEHQVGQPVTRSVFSPDDQLILTDNMLWDSRSGKQIHKFDLLSAPGLSSSRRMAGMDTESTAVCCSLFHPSQTRLMINSSLWDLRKCVFAA